MNLVFHCWRCSDSIRIRSGLPAPWRKNTFSHLTNTIWWQSQILVKSDMNNHHPCVYWLFNENVVKFGFFSSKIIPNLLCEVTLCCSESELLNLALWNIFVTCIILCQVKPQECKCEDDMRQKADQEMAKLLWKKHSTFTIWGCHLSAMHPFLKDLC